MANHDSPFKIVPCQICQALLGQDDEKFTVTLQSEKNGVTTTRGKLEACWECVIPTAALYEVRAAMRELKEARW